MTHEPLRAVAADDDPLQRTLLADMLARTPGIELVAVCEDGIDAVQAALAADADVAVLDVRMPRCDGIAAAELLRECRRDCNPILRTSASRDPDVVVAADALELPLVDKFDVDMLPDLLGETVARVGHHREHTPIDALALTALLARPDEAVVAVRSDRNVSFYNRRAAGLLGAPFPRGDGPLSFDTLGLRVVDGDGVEASKDSLPLEIALLERRAASGRFGLVGADGSVRNVESRAVPLYALAGSVFLGSTSYWRQAA